MRSKSIHSILIMLVNTCAFIGNSNGQPQNTDSAVYASQLIRIEQSLIDAVAVGDTTLWAKYLDKNFFIVTEDGTRYAREPFLATFQPLPKDFSGNIQVAQPKVIFHGNVAVVAYVADEHEFVFGQPLHTTYGTANTYYKTDTSWMMLASEVYEIPQLPPAIKVAANILQQYTGVYDLTDTVACRIIYERDTLFIQKKRGPKQALFAETNNVFFRLNDTRGRKIFTSDEAGNMIMLERRNGQDLVWKKVKDE